MTAAYGLCECGCGEPTPIATRDDAWRGLKKGQPRRFIYQHHARVQSKPRRPGPPRLHSAGYVLIYMPEHPTAHWNSRVYEHVLIAEAAIGKPLPPGAEVHHVNGAKDDNRTSNLVICQDHAYHMLLHVRSRALKGCGNPDWVRCRFCRRWGPAESMWVHPARAHMAHHRSCHNESRKSKKAEMEELAGARHQHAPAAD